VCKKIPTKVCNYFPSMVKVYMLLVNWMETGEYNRFDVNRWQRGRDI
jgi:hypothetical protein